MANGDSARGELPLVRSNTLVGDSKHSTGVVLAQLVRANMPVRNGVVHLISQPLMIVATNITEWLETQSGEGPASRFLGNYTFSYSCLFMFREII